MRIIYGVVGEGMGHATRSRVILEHLLTAGHSVRVVVSGRAHKFLLDCFKDRDRISIEEIHGLHLDYEGNAVDIMESLWSNLGKAPAGLMKNLEVYRKLAESGFEPQAVISDFESWAYLYGLNHMLPTISIDNMQVINRCRHDDDVTDNRSFNFRLAKAAVKAKMPGVYHYLIASFFFPPVRKKRTSLVPPILRPEILAAKREPREHVLVYQTAASNQDLVPTLQKLPHKFRVYGMGKDGTDGNVTLCPFSQQGFVDDLRTARAVIAGGGFSLMGEAVHLRVPMLSVPIEAQYEQELNARYLTKLGYGSWCPKLDGDKITAFLADRDKFQQALMSYQPRDNSMLFGCVDELLTTIEKGDAAPEKLQSPAMGKCDPHAREEDEESEHA